MHVKSYRKEILEFKPLIITILLIIGASYLFYNLADANTVILLGKEDSLFEWLTALCYFIASIFFFLTFKKNKNVFLLILCIVMFFGAGEEMSWGQRVFHFATPTELKKINVQGEFTIHNIEIFSNEKLNGETSHGYKRFLEMDFLFKVFTLLFGIALPFCVFHIQFITTLTQKMKIPVPPISIGIFFLISWGCLKLSISRIPQCEDMGQYWKVMMAGPEIAEFVGSYIMAIIAYYFYQRRKTDIMGRDFKQLI